MNAGAEHELAPQAVARNLQEGWQLIDVRTPREREAGYIPDSRHIELDRLASETETLERERPVIFYCRVGARSGMAADAFRASGWEAYNLSGGIAAWVESELPIEPQDGYVAQD